MRSVLAGLFENVHSAYAILTDRECKQIEEPLMYLATAGLRVRKAAWEKLIQNGFRSDLRISACGRLSK
jgi:hypothetical protein